MTDLVLQADSQAVPGEVGSPDPDVCWAALVHFPRTTPELHAATPRSGATGAPKRVSLQLVHVGAILLCAGAADCGWVAPRPDADKGGGGGEGL